MKKTTKTETAFRPGAKVIVDERYEATVVAHFPEGSTSYAFPYYRVRVGAGVGEVDLGGGFERVRFGQVWAVHVERVGVYKRAAITDSDPYFYDAVGAAGRW